MIDIIKYPSSINLLVFNWGGGKYLLLKIQN